MTTLSITNYEGTENAAVAVSVPRGEPLVATLTMLTSAGAARPTTGGTLSFNWERRGSIGAPIRATVAGDADGVSVITVAADTLKLMDGSYTFDTWYSPLTGDNECLVAKSTLSIATAVGPEGDILQYYATVGTTANRPVTPANGTQYYDTTINKAIWYISGGWVDATGATV